MICLFVGISINELEYVADHFTRSTERRKEAGMGDFIVYAEVARLLYKYSKVNLNIIVND